MLKTILLMYILIFRLLRGIIIGLLPFIPAIIYSEYWLWLLLLTIPIGSVIGVNDIEDL